MWTLVRFCWRYTTSPTFRRQMRLADHLRGPHPFCFGDTMATLTATAALVGETPAGQLATVSLVPATSSVPYNASVDISVVAHDVFGATVPVTIAAPTFDRPEFTGSVIPGGIRVHFGGTAQPQDVLGTVSVAVTG